MSTETPSALLLPNEKLDPVPYPKHFQEWFELCREHPYLWVTAGGNLNEVPPPKPLTSEQFLHLVGTLLNHTHRKILRAMLADLLRDDIIDVVQWYGESNQ